MLSRTINARGDLVITADAEGREEVMAWEGDAYGRNRPLIEVESRLFDAMGLEQMGPEEVGALTADPMWRWPTGSRGRGGADGGVEYRQLCEGDHHGRHSRVGEPGC